MKIEAGPEVSSIFHFRRVLLGLQLQFAVTQGGILYPDRRQAGHARPMTAQWQVHDRPV